MRRMIPIVAAVVLLAGCTATPTGTSTPSPSSSPGSDTAGACVEGTWVADAAATDGFFEKLAHRFPDLPVNAIDTTGTTSVTLNADGTFVYEPDVDFAIHYAKGGDGVGSLTGQATGTWSARDDTLFAQPDSNGVKLTVVLNGEERTGDTMGW